MTDPIDPTELAARLQAIHEEDHERGCEGRCYVCSCGYNDIIEQTARDAHAAILAQAARIAELEAALEPSMETKVDYIGEFSFNVTEMGDDGGEIDRMVSVPWTTIKEIMAAFRARAALKGTCDCPVDDCRGLEGVMCRYETIGWSRPRRPGAATCSRCGLKSDDPAALVHVCPSPPGPDTAPNWEGLASYWRSRYLTVAGDEPLQPITPDTAALVEEVARALALVEYGDGNDAPWECWIAHARDFLPIIARREQQAWQDGAKAALEAAAEKPRAWARKLMAEIEAIAPENRIGLPIAEKERTIHKLARLEQFIRAIDLAQLWEDR